MKARDESGDLELAARIERTRPPSPTPADLRELEREHLGPSWGRRRKRLKDWPKTRRGLP